MGKSCKVEEKKATKAWDKAMGIWHELMDITEKLIETTRKTDVCWTELYIDMKEKKLDRDTFEKRAKDCADLDEQEEKVQKSYDDYIIRTDNAHDAWKEAEAKWNDCVHKQTKQR